MFKLPQKIREEISAYSQAIEDYMADRSSWGRFSGIRVPWGNYSHRGGKVFMTRVRIPAGVLSPLQLKALAECSQKYGNGILHITTREDIQIHEIKLEDIIKIHNFLKDYELSSRGGGGNTVRNITACPLSGVCPKEIFDVREDAVALTEYLIADDISYNLPRKFKITFSGCQDDCSGLLANDVGLLAARQDGLLGFRVYVGGGMGTVSLLGRLLEDFILRKDLGYVVCAIRNMFYKYGDRKNKHHNRLRFLIQDLGFDRFKEYYQKELKELKETEYIFLRKVNFDYIESQEFSLPEVKEEEFRDFLEYNCLLQKQGGFSVVKLRIPRGDLNAEQAIRLSELSGEFKNLEFRTSVEQDLYLINIPTEKLYYLYSKLKDFMNDFLYPDTLLDIVACKGASTCNLGLCNSPALTTELEKIIKKDFINTKVFKKLNIKINGCPNACGQHPLGMLSFCGMARKVKGRSAPFYRIFLGGKKDLEDTQLSGDTGIFIPARNIPDFLRDFLKRIEKETQSKEDIYKFIEEKAKKITEEVSQNYTFVPDYSENREFYIDWGKQEEFSLSGLGPGECGAGVLDMIESDITETKIALSEAEKKDYSYPEIKKALFLAIRTLLVVKGIDPRSEEEAISGFLEKFVKEGIAHPKYRNLKDIFFQINEGLSLEERKEKFLYAKDFLSHIEELYKSMDSAFNFPKQAKPIEIPQEKTTKAILDLKGTPCPINYVKTKLFLENFKKGDILEVFLDEGEPMENVPKSLESDGHIILKIEKKNGFYSLIVEKGA